MAELLTKIRADIVAERQKLDDAIKRLDAVTGRKPRGRPRGSVKKDKTATAGNDLILDAQVALSASQEYARRKRQATHPHSPFIGRQMRQRGWKRGKTPDTWVRI